LAKRGKFSSEALQEFSAAYYNAIQELNGNAIFLPINETEISYDKQSDELYMENRDFKTPGNQQHIFTKFCSTCALYDQ
jgi:hypothetical protein